MRAMPPSLPSATQSAALWTGNGRVGGCWAAKNVTQRHDVHRERKLFGFLPIHVAGLRALFQRRVVYRNESIGGFAGSPQVPEARERNVRTADEISLAGCVGECEFVLMFCFRSIDVIADGYRGMLELNRRHMYDIAPEHELLASALDHIGRVPGRMTIRWF
jgi:hypothetical protein